MLVARRDRIVTVAAYDYGARHGVKVLGGAPGATDSGARIRTLARPRLTELAAQGLLHVPIAGIVELRRAHEADVFARRGHPGGKVVLRT